MFITMCLCVWVGASIMVFRGGGGHLGQNVEKKEESPVLCSVILLL